MGEICCRCLRVLQQGQGARSRGQVGWGRSVADVCEFYNKARELDLADRWVVYRRNDFVPAVVIILGQIGNWGVAGVHRLSTRVRFVQAGLSGVEI